MEMAGRVLVRNVRSATVEARVFQVRMLRLSLRRLIRAWSQKARKNARKPEKPAGKASEQDDTRYCFCVCGVDRLWRWAWPGLAH